MIIVLTLLFLKHFVVDFIMQTDDMVKGKGIYGNFIGIMHSAQHMLISFIILSFGLFLNWYELSVLCFVVIVEFIVHYHTDWIKMNFGCRDIKNKQFWIHLGLDQYVHAMTYVYMVYLLIKS